MCTGLTPGLALICCQVAVAVGEVGEFEEHIGIEVVAGILRAT